ncbi:hypothetical protein H0H87_002086 [Tephrocybe sp. NHM501043]|nr:hypothetical protein H0H87_002086 [Tephrocybe sp. NHM501043]
MAREPSKLLAHDEDDDVNQAGGKARARLWRDTPKRKNSQAPEEHTDQMRETNRLQCLRHTLLPSEYALLLTERCPYILLSVREEAKEAGNEVSEELTGPNGKLVE